MILQTRVDPSACGDRLPVLLVFLSEIYRALAVGVVAESMMAVQGKAGGTVAKIRDGKDAG